MIGQDQRSRPPVELIFDRVVDTLIARPEHNVVEGFDKGIADVDNLASPPWANDWFNRYPAV
jgi:hypothetical protein